VHPSRRDRSLDDLERYLEELAFEVVGEQSMKDITERAEDLSARGVRRLVAIFVKKGEVQEWSKERGTWILLDPASTFEDPTLTTPIAVKALLDRVEARRAVVRALHAQNDPEIAAIEAQGRAEMGRRLLFTVVGARGLRLTEVQRERIEACSDPEQLDRWARAAAVATSSDALFADA